jgi:Ca2+-binding EF-hand superfamily protein
MITFLLSALAMAADPTTPPTTGNPNTPTQPGTNTPGSPTPGTTPGSTTPVNVVAFEDLDLNSDLSLDRSEIGSHPTLVTEFTALDVDKNGKLSMTEYRVYHDRQAALSMPVFENLDVNKDLSLDKTELAKLQDMTRDFATIDVDKNGKLSKNEFQTWISRSAALPTFESLDLNRDMLIDSTEINKSDVLKRDMKLIDTDKNGKVSQEEYKAWMDQAGRG